MFYNNELVPNCLLERIKSGEKSHSIFHYKDLLKRIPCKIERPFVSALIKDMVLALAFPLLIYIANYYFNFLIWIAFIPVIILAYEKSLKVSLYTPPSLY